MTQQTEKIATSYRVSQIVRQIMKWIFVWGLLFLTACDLNLTNPAASLDAPFWLNYGGYRVLAPDNVTIGFRQILYESRCGLRSVCVWEGRAAILLRLKDNKTGSTLVTASIPGYITQKNTRRHLSTDTLGYKITLMQLDPYPGSTVLDTPFVYKALLRVSKMP